MTVKDHMKRVMDDLLSAQVELGYAHKTGGGIVGHYYIKKKEAEIKKIRKDIAKWLREVY